MHKIQMHKSTEVELPVEYYFYPSESFETTKTTSYE